MFCENAHRHILTLGLLAKAADSYANRIMLGMIFSLSVVLALTNVPIGPSNSGIGWYVASPNERLTVDMVEARTIQPKTTGAPITEFEDEEEEMDERGDESEADVSTTDVGSVSQGRSVERLSGRRVVDFTNDMPKIVGGMGAYYIHIDYPQSAVEAGIEGRLVLSFVVDTSGRTSDIEVLESLFPPCDSAAVQALRRTRFVPGQQDGETVPVRMRLPVRFKLLGRAETAANVGL